MGHPGTVVEAVPDGRPWRLPPADSRIQLPTPEGGPRPVPNLIGNLVAATSVGQTGGQTFLPFADTITGYASSHPDVIDGCPHPKTVATFTTSYPEIVFGLFEIRGYQFSPSIADLGDIRL